MAIRERRKRIYRKRIPYGMQSFEDIMERDCYYVAKTPFIEDIEESHMYFFYIRPRRFGKSLTLSMLENYYDINKADKFESLFGKLYIGENPTPEHNQYLIIHLNFAVVNAGLDDYKKGMDAACNLVFLNFCDIYKQYLPEDVIPRMKAECNDAVSQLSFLCAECLKVGKKIYLFIDEYDLSPTRYSPIRSISPDTVSKPTVRDTCALSSTPSRWRRAVRSPVSS